MSVNIIGISALYHDSACCILCDGVLKAAAQEERFTRKKHDPSMPYHAFRYCLEQAGLDITDIDYVAYYENPVKKLSRQLWSRHYTGNEDLMIKLSPRRPEMEMRDLLGYEGPIKMYDHHRSHAASAYYYSGFDDSAIFTVDGVGEWATTTYGVGSGVRIDMLEEVHFPHSIGLLYSAITNYLGFEVNEGEYKVMGLAPYGKPLYTQQIRQLIHMDPKGQFRLEMKYYDFMEGKRMFSDVLCELFGRPQRQPESRLDQFEADVAKSLQVVLEEILLQKAEYLYDITRMDNLCMAGGVALNCVANGNILRKGPFRKLFVQPAANDSGCALGAAALAYVDATGRRPQNEQLTHVYLGPAYDNNSIANILEATSFKVMDYRNDEEGLLRKTARLLADGKVIGWFHGRMEFGPRSLGARSILADPRDPGMRDKINRMVKKREGFRPFAPAVLEEAAFEYFDLDHISPFMLETCRVTSGLDLPAITHVDGSARVQTVSDATNPRFAGLLRQFCLLTGCPILLNTSFNVRGEPIVCSPEDALKCFITTEIDFLVLQDFIICRTENEFDLMAWMISLENSAFTITHDVYTFV